MLQKYVYSFNSLKPLVRGLVPFVPEVNSKQVVQMQDDKKYVWRNSVTDGYKINAGYMDTPMDLSNFLLLRTREAMLLQMRVNSPDRVESGSMLSKLSGGSNKEQMLNSVHLELSEGLTALEKMFYVDNQESDLPVAFATNVMYVLAKNNSADSDIIRHHLLPVLKSKAEYLHAEGVCQAVHGLQAAGVYDEDVWAVLKQAIADKNFNIEYVKNDRYSLDWFTLSGTEHYNQADVNAFTNELFFEDKINMYEMYNSLLAADKAAPQLALGETIQHVQQKYASLLSHNDTFNALKEQSFVEREQLTE